MVKKSLLLQKLASYSTLATVVLATEHANAQILYTKVDTTICPESTGNHNPFYATYNLDLNNDGVIDFYIVTKAGRFFPPYNITYEFSEMANIDNNNNGVVADVESQNRKVAALFNSGQEIGTIDNFAENNLALINKDVYYYLGGNKKLNYFGLWDITVHEKFLGLKLKVNSNTYYGWARLSVINNIGVPHHSYCIELKDYAVNMQPGAPIIAGDTVSAIPPLPTSNSLSLFPDPVSRQSKLNLSVQLINSQTSTIIIYDITGREVRSIDLPNTAAGTNNLQIDIADLAAGMYILKFTSAQFESTQKFVIAQ